jgi:MFS transporter, DHA2 family, multidrug resistance protein
MGVRQLLAVKSGRSPASAAPGGTVSAMIPTAFTAAVVRFQRKQKAIAASCVSAAAGLAPTLGPVIGGWITDDWSWHWLFYINIVPGLAVRYWLRSS